MANSPQAKKRVRQNIKKRNHNIALRTKFRTAIKKVTKIIGTGDKNLAQQTFKESVKIIDSIASKKIFHKNKAARHKSRLSAKIKSME